MADDMSRYHSRSPSPASPDFHYARTGGGDSASGGSGGSGVECLQLRSQPFHYLISEQAKSFVALQELQNEVGALLEFRDLVIETFPNLRSKMAPPGCSQPARARDWEPGVRVRRKLNAGGAGEQGARAKPQPSVQDSGFSTETSCKSGGGGGGSNAGAGAAALEDELWALLDVIQRKGTRLRDDAEVLRAELEPTTRAADEWFARALASAPTAPCLECQRRREKHAAAPAETEAARTPLGRLDGVLATPPRPPIVRTPDSAKFAAILRESNPVELQRHLLVSTVQTQLLETRAQRSAQQQAELMERLRRARDLNDDLRFQLEEKTIELEGARAAQRLAEARAADAGGTRGSMRDLRPVPLPAAPDPPATTATTPDPPAAITDTPKRTRRSRIPLPGHKLGPPASYRSRSNESQSWRTSMADPRSRTPAAVRKVPAAPPSTPAAPTSTPGAVRKTFAAPPSTPGAVRKASAVPVRQAPRAPLSPRPPARRDEEKVRTKSIWNILFNFKEANSA